jgi:pimeloyl-[acyl-carrier protein] methyl ester esterase
MRKSQIAIIAGLLAAITSGNGVEAKTKARSAKVVIKPATTKKADPVNLADAVVQATRFTVKLEPASPASDAAIQDVVLIPGLASPREVWDATVAQLRGRYRLHIVQIRGFGDDAAINANGPVLEPFVKELAEYIDTQIVKKGHGKPAIIGHSMGGLSAAMIAARYPDLPAEILIEDSLPFIGLLFAPNATVDMVKPQAALMRDRGLAAGKQPASEATLQTMSATDAGRAQVAKWGERSDYRVTMQVFYDVLTTDIRPELGKITAPVTLLYPYDPIVGSAERITALYTDAYKGLPGIKMKRIDNSRHFIMLDQPQKFAEAVTAFLAE